MVTIPGKDYLEQQGVIVHYGTPRKSGRYPWGSGDNPMQRSRSFNAMYNQLQEQGLSEADIARAMGFESTTQLRDTRTLVRNELKQDQIHMARKLKEKGHSNGAIAKRMQEAGYTDVNGESQVRNLLKDSQERKVKVIDNVADTLKRAVAEKKYVDVGSGVEFQMDITSTRLRSVLRKLKDEGYVVHNVDIEQLGTGQMTTHRVLAAPDTKWGEVYKNRGNIKQITEYSEDGGLTSLGILPPLSVSSKRVAIRYKEQGGDQADGVIYVRRGPKDISLGRAPYAQVRVMVDGTHYLKGMAIYKDDLPDGVDLMFNTNKKDTGNKLDAMKAIKDDPDNPFGSTVRQIGERDPKTGRLTKLTSAMNLVNEQGDWDKWSKNLSSQMLSKQRPALAKEQLDIAYENKKAEYDAIMRLDNPSVRAKLLEAFADGADSAAVHLKAAHLPRQRTQVILPVNSLKPNEIYAPNFKPGETVALIRFPHGGTFEIPELVVNHKNPEARKLLGDSTDAVGISHKVAERLSGADFDGDTVLVIPNNMGKIQTRPPLEGLKDFQPQERYPYYEGMKVMTPYEKGMEMGRISNLITDMTIRKANTDELARAVRHSMVVIDAEKHKLDYKRSYEENGIAALIKAYQPDAKTSQGGASTLVSMAKARFDVNERKQGYKIDPKTGKKIYTETGKVKTWTDEKGKVHTKIAKQQSTKLAETDDAHTLSSGTVMEKMYADHSNRLKALGNQARKDLVKIKPRRYNAAARNTYQKEVEELTAAVNLALKNAPRERQAQVLANAIVRQKMQDNPVLKTKEGKAELKKIKSQALSAMRARTGADKPEFNLTPKHWEAIQNGAVTPHKLNQILTYADLDQIKKLATPKEEVKMPPARVSRARIMHRNGYSWAEIADALGVSVSTAQKAVLDTEEGD